MICLRYGRNRQEAEDMLQDGLVGIFRDTHQFDSQKASFAVWANRVVANAARQYLRKWKQLDFVDNNLNEISHTLPSEDNIYDVLGAKELTKVIQRLPTGYRVVFNMYVVEGFKHDEIAKHLGISVSTSKSQLFKAKRILRKQIEIMFEY